MANVQGFLLKAIGVISLCMILVLPDRFYQDAAFFCVTPLIRHPGIEDEQACRAPLVSASQI